MQRAIDETKRRRDAAAGVQRRARHHAGDDRQGDPPRDRGGDPGQGRGPQGGRPRRGDRRHRGIPGRARSRDARGRREPRVRARRGAPRPDRPAPLGPGRRPRAAARQPQATTARAKAKAGGGEGRAPAQAALIRRTPMGGTTDDAATRAPTVPRLLTEDDVATIVAEAERSLPIRVAGISCARSADLQFADSTDFCVQALNLPSEAEMLRLCSQ